MNIVLTGSHGFVGARLLYQLKTNPDYNVLSIDRNKVNIYNYLEMGQYIINNLGNDFVIIHTAAMSDTKACEENHEEAYRANVLYTQNLAHIAYDFDNPIIFLSSDQVYDYFSEKDHFEYNIPNPTNFYGKTKLWGENVIKEICPKHFILRLTWQFDIIRSNMPNKGIIYNIYNSVNENKIITQSKKSYRYITWVNATILYIIQILEQYFPCGTYNVASVTDKNCYDLYKYVFRQLGIPHRQYLKSDSKLKPINLTPYPYALEALGSEIITFENTLDNLLKSVKK